MESTQLDKILGQQIQIHRQNKGWSQEYLAEVTGLHRTYISQLERGLKSPSVRVLNHIRALGMSISRFFQRVEELLDREDGVTTNLTN
jgi:transcriptional regulator with XRE-family HTH domain